MTLTSPVRAPTRFEVLGVQVSAVTMPMALATIVDWIATDARTYICVADSNGIVSASSDETLRQVYNGSGMTLPDGMPLVWSAHRAGFTQVRRVCGPDLLPNLLAEMATRGWSSYFYGGEPGVADRMAERLSATVDGMQVAGTASPPFRPLTAAETAADMSAINDSGAQVVWVGLGAPKQERWMAEHRHLLTAPVIIGIGAAFQIHAGEVRRAPRWMQRSGLEWAFRIQQEPRRLWRRYVRTIPAFLWGVLRSRPRPVDG